MTRRPAGIGVRRKRRRCRHANRRQCNHSSRHGCNIGTTCRFPCARRRRHTIGIIAHLLRHPAAGRLAQGHAQCVALRKSCLHGRALCRLRLFGLRGCGSKHAGHRGGRFEPQCVVRCVRCSALGFCLARGASKPGIHRRRRGMHWQRTQ
ncbi:hypothetical protein EYR27_11785 [Xanthomonas oryzae]|nr:hypothetical protein EYR27_11785 [Xanthomonas oryzae]